MKYFQCSCPTCGFEFGFSVPEGEEDNTELIKECAECPCGDDCDIIETEI